MDYVGIFYGYLEYISAVWNTYITAVWNILRLFSNVVVIWYVLSRFWYIISRKIWRPCFGRCTISILIACDRLNKLINSMSRYIRSNL
jgi:hypothetical protein